MSDALSVDQCARHAGVLPGRVYDYLADGWISAQKIGPVYALTTVHAAIVAVIATAIDAGAAPYVVRQLAERLARCASAAAVERYVSRVAIVHEARMWRLVDGNLNAGALAMLRLSNGRTIRFA